METPLLALILTGNPKKVLLLLLLQKKATLPDYHRGSVLGKDYPTLVKSVENDLVESMIFYPRSMDDRRKLHNFDGEVHAREIVNDVLEPGEQVEASIFIRSGGKGLSHKDGLGFRGVSIK